ncbi:MAG: hypothetical protein WC860_09495 [Candidatus Margulisiibacteriota bacterium]|jgi:hypothetical protein
MGIPIIAVQTSLQNAIPQGVAELPGDLEAPEIIPYVISFAKYNEKLCEIQHLEKNKARRSLEIIKEIGTKICCSADFKKFNIEIKHIDRSGEYLKLYNRLSPDIEINEIKVQHDARIFYFDIESEKKLYIVAIKENHFEVGKVRRG